MVLYERMFAGPSHSSSVFRNANPDAIETRKQEKKTEHGQFVFFFLDMVAENKNNNNE